MNAYIIALIIVFSVIAIRILPSNKIVAYALLIMGMSPMVYFCKIRYYFKDHAANTAGAYIVFAAFCAVILAENLKRTIPKIALILDILKYISFSISLCLVLLYGSKISFIVLILFVILRTSRVLEFMVLKNKYLYIGFVICLLLAPIAVSIVTKGLHLGLTYLYVEGGIIPFAASFVGILYWLLGMYEYANTNGESSIVFESVILCMILLWLDSSFVSFPLVFFVLIYGYVMQTLSRNITSTEERELTKGGAEEYTKKDKVITSIVLAMEMLV